jgi:hypothetical protein
MISTTERVIHCKAYCGRYTMLASATRALEKGGWHGTGFGDFMCPACAQFRARVAAKKNVMQYSSREVVSRFAEDNDDNFHGD